MKLYVTIDVTRNPQIANILATGGALEVYRDTLEPVDGGSDA